MIFVTVGTHEQPFNRLIECIDRLKQDDAIPDEVMIQTGFSTYEPRYCKWQKLFSYSEMLQYVKDARIVITHGGPSSFIMPLQLGKIPIVVPRQKQYGEHVNDHQMEFCRQLAERMKTIIVVDDVKTIARVLSNYKSIIGDMDKNNTCNNALFNMKLEQVVDSLF